MYRNQTSLTVTGVFRNQKGPTHLDDFPLLVSWDTFYAERNPEWLSNMNYIAYLLLHEGSDKAVVEQKMAESLDQHTGAMIRQIGGEAHLHLRPLREILPVWRLFHCRPAHGGNIHGACKWRPSGCSCCLSPV